MKKYNCFVKFSKFVIFLVVICTPKKQNIYVLIWLPILSCVQSYSVNVFFRRLILCRVRGEFL
jgi:hypothetical protein